MKIFCDADGTILNSIKRIVDLYTTDFHLYKNFHPIHWTQINTWEMSELTLANRNIILDYFSDIRFFDKKLEFMDNALEILTELSKDHEIIICTLGTPLNLKYKKEYFEKTLTIC
jgi:5'(3')-deoxyribonucleotidase